MLILHTITRVTFCMNKLMQYYECIREERVKVYPNWNDFRHLGPPSRGRFFLYCLLDKMFRATMNILCLKTCLDVASYELVHLRYTLAFRAHSLTLLRHCPLSQNRGEHLKKKQIGHIRITYQSVLGIYRCGINNIQHSENYTIFSAEVILSKVNVNYT